MSVVALQVELVDMSPRVIDFDLGRPFLKRGIFQLISTRGSVVDSNVWFRLTNQGQSILPIYTRGASLDIAMYNDLDLDINQAVQGPPYDLRLELYLNASPADTLWFCMALEAHYDKYAKVRLKEFEGRSLIVPTPNIETDPFRPYLPLKDQK